MSGDFADRFDPSIAAAMIELGAQIEGLPGYLGIELTRAAILDHVTGAVIYPLMPAGSWGATTELKLNYIAPVQAGEVQAEATVLAMTKRSAVVRGELHYGGRLCSAAQGTITVVRPRYEGGS
jgi:hypothetical protein